MVAGRASAATPAASQKVSSKPFAAAPRIAAGMVLFGDGLPAGALGVARLLSFAAVVAGAVLLTRGPGAPLDVGSAATVSAR